MKTKGINKKTILKAIEGSSGLILTIAQRLNVSRGTIYKYLREYPELTEALKEEKSNVLDFTESKLLKAVENGESWAIRFVLLNQGQSRGYGNRDFKLEEIKEKFNNVVINFISPKGEKEQEIWNIK